MAPAADSFRMRPNPASTYDRLVRLLPLLSTQGRVMGALLLILVADGTIRSWSLWAAIVILCREILVSGLREFLAELKVSVPVSRVAKWKTTMQMIALGFLIAGRAGEVVLPGTVRIGLGLLWVSAILTLYTGWDYFRAGIKYVVEE